MVLRINTVEKNCKNSEHLFGSTSLWVASSLVGSLAILFLALFQPSLSSREIFNDPADTVGFNPLLGLVSMLGLFGWAAAAGIALLTYIVVRSRETVLKRRFFVAAGVFTLLLLVDDAFMLHEKVLPDSFGIRERYIKMGYLIIAATFGMSFFKVLIRNNFGILVAAGTFFVASFVFDNPATLQALGWWENSTVLYVVEDGSKFIGIILWVAYLSKTAVESLNRLMRN